MRNFIGIYKNIYVYMSFINIILLYYYYSILLSFLQAIWPPSTLSGPYSGGAGVWWATGGGVCRGPGSTWRHTVYRLGAYFIYTVVMLYACERNEVRYSTSEICMVLKRHSKHEHQLLAIYNPYICLYYVITALVETDITAINQAKDQKRAFGPGPADDSAGEAQGAGRETNQG